MRKIVIIVLLFVFIPEGHTQQLHIGSRAGISKTSISSEMREYHWSNIENESDFVNGVKEETLFISPSFITITYESKRGLFAYVDLKNYSYSMQYDLKMEPVSYFVEQIGAFTDIDGNTSVSYPWELQINTNYFSGEWGLGYTFLKNKLVKPTIYLGMNHMVLLSISEKNPALAQRNFDETSFVNGSSREVRNNIIYNDLNRFDETLSTVKAGIGLKAYNVALNFSVEQNIGDIDTAGFYDTVRNFYVNVSIDLISISLAKKSRLSNE